MNKSISDLLVPISQLKNDFGSPVAYAHKETYSAEQAMMQLGLSAKYSGAELKAKHNSESAATRSTVTVTFVQNCFTISVDTPTTPADFFSSDFSINDILEQEALGRIGTGNAPVFLSSITYGRIIYLTVSSSSSMSDLVTTLNAAFSFSGGGVQAELSAAEKKIFSESKFTVTTVGIEAKDVEKLIRTRKVEDAFPATLSLI
jgi:thiol-activated cytolysin